MCHFIISEDVYTECLLWKKAVALDSKPAETSKEAQLTGLLSLLPRFSGQSKATDATVGIAGPSNGPAETISAKPDLAVHTIEQKVYFQCHEARENPDLFDIQVDKRFCPGARESEIHPDAPEQNGKLNSRVQKKLCPVCVAAQRAVEEHSKQIKVIPAPPKPPVDSLTPAASPLVNTRTTARPNPYGDPPHIRVHGPRDGRIPRVTDTDEDGRNHGRRKKKHRHSQRKESIWCF